MTSKCNGALTLISKITANAVFVCVNFYDSFVALSVPRAISSVLPLLHSLLTLLLMEQNSLPLLRKWADDLMELIHL